MTFGAGTDLTIGLNNGGELKIDLDGAVTIQDVIDRINNNVANQNSATRVVAAVHPTANALTLTTPSAGATQPLSVRVAGVARWPGIWDWFPLDRINPQVRWWDRIMYSLARIPIPKK